MSAEDWNNFDDVPATHYDGPTVKEIAEAARRHEEAVHHPGHYCRDGVECITAIKASMSRDAYKGYLKGNCLKYLWRWELKGGLQDLEKASVYLNWLIGEVKA